MTAQRNPTAPKAVAVSAANLRQRRITRRRWPRRSNVSFATPSSTSAQNGSTGCNSGAQGGRKCSRTFAGTASRLTVCQPALPTISTSTFDGFGKLVGGTRRHNMIYTDDLSTTWEPTGLRLRFTLPSGCYATVLLREVMKADVAGEETGEE